MYFLVDGLLVVIMLLLERERVIVQADKDLNPAFGSREIKISTLSWSSAILKSLIMQHMVFLKSLPIAVLQL